MSENKHSVRVNIFNKEYVIKGDTDPGYIEALAQYVDDKIREVVGNTGLAAELKVVILASMNIADELYRTRRELKEEKERAVAEIRDRLLREKDHLKEGLDKERQLALDTAQDEKTRELNLLIEEKQQEKESALKDMVAIKEEEKQRFIEDVQGRLDLLINTVDEKISGASF